MKREVDDKKFPRCCLAFLPSGRRLHNRAKQQRRAFIPTDMSDWFKFYNDTLDTAPLQYAMGEHPEVVTVYTLILSEASKNRSERVPWTDNSASLLGYCRKINLRLPIFNECINLLAKIGYVRIESGFLIVLSWNKMQSAYCKGVNRGYYGTKKTLVSTSLVSTARGEERRGESMREENDLPLPKDAMPPMVPKLTKKRPSLEEMKLIGAKAGICEEDCIALWNKWEGNGWKNGKVQIRSVPHTMASWKAYGYLPSQQRTKGNRNNSPLSLKIAMDAKESEAKEIKAKHTYEDGQGTHWQDEAARLKYLELRTDYKELRSRIQL